MIDREKRGDVVAAWMGPRVEYWVMEGLPACEGNEDWALELERGFDQLGAEGWHLACRVGGGNQFLVFWREVRDAAGATPEIPFAEEAGRQSGQAQGRQQSEGAAG